VADQSFDEKTEAPTAKRRNEAREKGTVAKSTEINSVLVLLAGLILLKLFGPWMMKEMSGCIVEYLRQAGKTQMDVGRMVELTTGSIILMLKILMPVSLGILVVGVLSNVLQVGFLFTTQPLVPNLNKIDPFSGMKRLFSARSTIEAFKNILKLIVIGAVAYWTIQAEFGKMLLLSDSSIGGVLAFSAVTAYKIILRVALVLIILAILDYAYVRHDHEKKLKMTKQEVKEEAKQMEGDPQVKSRIKSVQREMVRRRMMSQVPKATVVVTNPTHLAIALRYEPGEGDAPVVLAKGKRIIAERIKQIARENGIPLVEDKPLARAMYDKVEPGFPIPAEFFTAVAEIMAYVYRLKNRRAA
jgi:flagellar biosynthesis protein FlhB